MKNSKKIWTEHIDCIDTINTPKLRIMGIEERDKVQAKNTDSILNKIIAQNFPSIERG
jgi:hypothetical protein